jgi:hypothetical protein
MTIKPHQSWWRETLKLYLQYLAFGLSAIPAYFIIASVVGFDALAKRPAMIAVLGLGSAIGLAGWLLIGRWFDRPTAVTLTQATSNAIIRQDLSPAFAMMTVTVVMVNIGAPPESKCFTVRNTNADERPAKLFDVSEYEIHA